MNLLLLSPLLLLACAPENARRVHGHTITYPVGRRRGLYASLGDRQHGRRRGPHGWHDVEWLRTMGRHVDADRVMSALLKRERRAARRATLAP